MSTDRTPTDPDHLAAVLHATTDAMVWAEAFCDLFTPCSGPPTEGKDRGESVGLMVGWYANAIEVGRTAGRNAARPAFVAEAREIAQHAKDDLVEAIRYEECSQREADVAACVLDTFMARLELDPADL